MSKVTIINIPVPVPTALIESGSIDIVAKREFNYQEKVVQVNADGDTVLDDNGNPIIEVNSIDSKQHIINETIKWLGAKTRKALEDSELESAKGKIKEGINQLMG